MIERSKDPSGESDWPARRAAHCSETLPRRERPAGSYAARAEWWRPGNGAACSASTKVANAMASPSRITGWQRESTRSRACPACGQPHSAALSLSAAPARARSSPSLEGKSTASRQCRGGPSSFTGDLRKSSDAAEKFQATEPTARPLHSFCRSPGSTGRNNGGTCRWVLCSGRSSAGSSAGLPAS